MKKQLIHIFSILLLLISFVCAPAYAAAPAKKKSKQQIQRETLAQKKAKEREKAQKKKAKDKAKAQAKKDREKVKREKAKERANDKAFNQPIHYLSLWAGGGYSGMVDSYKPWSYTMHNYLNTTEMDKYAGVTGTMENKFIGGGGGKLGLGWEMHYKRFMMGVGPEFRVLTSIDNMSFSDPFNTDHASVNTWGKDYGAPFMYQHYNLPAMRETQTVAQVTLPILFGANFDKVYFLAGAKIGYSVVGYWKQRASLNTSVTVPMAVDDWTDLLSRNQVTSELAEHPLYQGEGKGMHSWGLDAVLTAEIGLNLNDFFSDEWNSLNEEKTHPWRFRVGAFVDYGLPILRAVGNDVGKPLAAADASSFKTVSLHESSAASSRVSSLLVGVKFTALFQINKPKMPNPMLLFLVSDTTVNDMMGKGIAGATVEIRDMQNPKRKPRLRKMDRDGKLGMRMEKGRYDMIGRAPGYLPSDYAGDTLHFVHQEDRNLAHLRLIPEPKLVVFVHNRETEQLVGGAMLAFTSDQDIQNNRSVITPATEPGVANLHYGDTYNLMITAPEYFPDSMPVTKLTDTLHIMMRPIHRVRHTLILRHMYFATDKSDILPGSEEDLMKLYNFLSENPRIRVLITGHTDNEGRDDYNQRLSENRAASVKAEMVRRGIDPNRMETNGKGESEPIDTNDTPEGRQINRRVQVTVLNEMDAEEDIF